MFETRASVDISGIYVIFRRRGGLSATPIYPTKIIFVPSYFAILVLIREIRERQLPPKLHAIKCSQDPLVVSIVLTSICP